MKATRPSLKTLLAETLEQHIVQNLPLHIHWSCLYCHDEHQGNLLKKATALALDPDLEISQPDIALLDNEGKVFAVIEIVTTRKPKKGVLEFYKKQRIILIQILRPSAANLEQLQQKIMHPMLVTTCLNPRCEKCGNFKQKTMLTIVDGPCWKCSATIKVAAIRKAGHTLGPDKFSKAEIEAARSKGVNIQEKYSRTAEETYLANSCHCGVFVGNHYLFTDYISPGSCGILPSEEFEIGYHCEACYEAMSY